MFSWIYDDSKPTKSQPEEKDFVTQWMKMINSVQKKSSPPQESFFKKCWNFILNVGYWLILIPIFLVIALIVFIFQFMFKLIQILYRKFRQTGSIKGWREELGNQYPKLKEAAIILYYLVYHYIVLPAYLLGLLMIIVFKVCKAGLGKLYVMGKSKLGINFQRKNRQHAHNQSNPDKSAQIKQLQNKITSLTQQLSQIRQSHLSSTTSSKTHFQQQSTKLSHLTQQLQQKLQQSSQINQKSIPSYERKVKQQHEKLTVMSSQMTRLKLEQEFEVEKVRREKDIMIEGLREKVKELGGELLVDRTLGEEGVGKEEGEGEHWEDEEQDDEEQEDEQEQDKIARQKVIPKQQIHPQKTSSNRSSVFCQWTLKLILFVLSVNIARLYSKVIQTNSIHNQ